MSKSIAVIFDFDDTLAPDSTSGFLEKCGIDVERFWREEVDALLRDAWDPVPAYLYKMLEYSQSEHGVTIRREALQAWGAELPVYRGVKGLFTDLERYARESFPDVTLEFYLVSSGIGDIIRSTPIAKHFRDIWACDFHYNDDGSIRFPKRIVSFTDKTRYLFHISKGLVGDEHRALPFEVNKKLADSELHIPLQHMIFVGDGHTDVPCFSLVRSNGGIAFGVYSPDEEHRWGRAWGFIEDGRVSNLVPADYQKRGALVSGLKMAIANIASKIELEPRAYRG